VQYIENTEEKIQSGKMAAFRISRVTWTRWWLMKFCQSLTDMLCSRNMIVGRTDSFDWAARGIKIASVATL